MFPFPTSVLQSVLLISFFLLFIFKPWQFCQGWECEITKWFLFAFSWWIRILNILKNVSRPFAFYLLRYVICVIKYHNQKRLRNERLCFGLEFQRDRDHHHVGGTAAWRKYGGKSRKLRGYKLWNLAPSKAPSPKFPSTPQTVPPSGEQVFKYMSLWETISLGPA